MDKVKLPKKVADAISSVRDVYKAGAEYDLEMLLLERWPYTDAIAEYVRESRENLQRYFQALVNGYEVEETPEDILRKYYNLNRPHHTETKDYFNVKQATADAIVRTLDILGIKIEGVNA